MTPWTEQQFMTEAHIGSGGEGSEVEDALAEFLRSHGFHDVAKHVAGMTDEARWAGWQNAKEEVSEECRADMEHFCGKLRSALGRDDTDAMKALIDEKLGQDEDGYQLKTPE